MGKNPNAKREKKSRFQGGNKKGGLEEASEKFEQLQIEASKRGIRQYIIRIIRKRETPKREFRLVEEIKRRFIRLFI